MKRLLTIPALAALVAVGAACGGGGEAPSTDQTPAPTAAAAVTTDGACTTPNAAGQTVTTVPGCYHYLDFDNCRIILWNDGIWAREGDTVTSDGWDQIDYFTVDPCNL